MENGERPINASTRCCLNSTPCFKPASRPSDEASFIHNFLDKRPIYRVSNFANLHFAFADLHFALQICISFCRSASRFANLHFILQICTSFCKSAFQNPGTLLSAFGIVVEGNASSQSERIRRDLQ